MTVSGSPDERRFYTVLAASFMPSTVRGLMFIPAGSFAPILLPLGLGSLMLWTARGRGRAFLRVVKLWAIWLVLFGVARIGLMILFYFAGVDESHVTAHNNAWFHGLSLAHIVVGVFLFGSARKRLRRSTAAPPLGPE